MSSEIHISIQEIPLDLANIEIGKLLEMIENNAVEEGVLKDIQETSIRKESMDTQDFGATLVLVLGTPAAIAIAKGVHDYISRSGNKVEIRTPSGFVKATGSAAQNVDIAKTVEALSFTEEDNPNKSGAVLRHGSR